MKTIIALLVLGILLFGCASYNNAPGTAPGTSNQSAPQPGGTPNASGTPSGGSGAAAVTVHIKDFAFNPADVTVNKGDTVVWVNDDNVPHIVKFPDFQSGTLATGDSFEHRFDAAGEYAYVCGIHASMQGKVTVG